MRLGQPLQEIVVTSQNTNLATSYLTSINSTGTGLSKELGPRKSIDIVVYRKCYDISNKFLSLLCLVAKLVC